MVAPAAQALTAAQVWDTVEANAATISSFQASLSSTGTFINTATSTWEGQATATGSLKTKAYSGVPGGLIKRLQSSSSTNMNNDTYRGTDGVTYIEFTSSSEVKKRDTALAGLDETPDLANATYVGTGTIDGTAVHIIDAAYGSSNTALTSARFYIDTTKGVILKRENFNGTTLAELYTVDPDDVTQIGSTYLATKSTRTRCNGLDGYTTTLEDTLTSITVNGTIDNSEFNYTVPSGFAVQDLD
jgi:hypothetical protein